MWLNIAAFIIILMLGGLLYQVWVLTQMMSKNLMSQNILDKVDDLQKLLERKGSNFYNKQIVKAPHGKCARQIGNYKYQPYKYGDTKVIPIIAFK